MNDYPRFKLSFPEQRDWIFSRVLAHRAGTHADRPFLQFMEEPALTYAEVDRLVNRYAHGLLELGVSPGDRVLLMLPNSLDVVLLWAALNRIRAIEVPVNNAYKGHFLEHLVNNSGAKVIVADAGFIEPLARSEERVPRLETVVVRGAEDGGRVPSPFARLRTMSLAEICARDERPPDVALCHRDLGAIMYTSGTTGPSKGVMMPNAFCHFFAETVVNLTRLTGDDVYFVTTPLYHGNAPLMQVYPSLLAGAKAVIWPRFSASEWVEQIRRVGATATTLLGIMMDFVYRQPPRESDARHGLRVLLGQPAPAAILHDFKRRFGIPRVLEYYGMTEISVVTLMPWDGVRAGSCGVAVSEWFDLRIADPETDEELPPGQVGELLVRPKMPWVFNQGYWEMPDRTAEAMRNVWYHTGDALKRDDDGYYYFVDRMRDVIRRRAVNISSYDVETVVAGHPAVEECAAVAVPTEFAGGEDEIKICLVLKPGASLVPAQFCAWCEDSLPYFAVPRYIEILPALPKTLTNKVQKYLLRRAGITPGTWDRIAAGVRLEQEIRKSERRASRQRGDSGVPPRE